MKRILLTILLIVGLGACRDGGGAAAVVNGDEISAESIDNELEDIAKNQVYLRARADQGAAFYGSKPGTYDAAVVAEVLNQRITATLVEQELKLRGIAVEQSDRDEARDAIDRELIDPATNASMFGGFPERYREQQVRIRASSDRLQADEGRVRLDEDSLRAFYGTRIERFQVWCAHHVLRVTDGAEAVAAIRAEILAGADFAEVARTKSEDPETAPKGGDVGCLTRDGLDQLVPPFRDAVLALPAGGLSEPVRSELGTHIIRVTEIKVRPFEEVRPVVRAQALQGAEEPYEQLLRRLRRDADVRVAERFGRWDRSDVDAIRVSVQ